MKKLLLVFAHPDDESFTSAGSVAKYVKAGWQVDSICATRGEAGMSGEYGSVTPHELGVIRQKELTKAAGVVGITSLTFMDYIDGTLVKQHAGELEDKIYKALFAFLPDAVITFEPNGISNHPDHIKISLSTTYAFQKYARFLAKQQDNGQTMRIATKNQGASELPSEEPRLYYTCMPQSVADYLHRKKMLPEESFGKPWRGTPDKFITTVIDIRKFEKVKKNALLCHTTQQGDVQRFLSYPTSALLHKEYFIKRFHGIHEVFMGKNDRVANKL